MSSRRITMIALGILAGIVVLMCVFSIYRVEEGEEALVLTFGEVTGRQDPGLHWHIPIVQSVRKQSITKIYTVEYGFRTSQAGTTSSGAQYYDVNEEAIMLTNDSNIVQVEAIYQVVVRDASSFFYEVHEPFDTLQFAFETVMRRNIQNRTLDDALLNKQDIESQVLPDFRHIVDTYDLGVSVKQVKIQNINVPAEVQEAYEDVNNAKNEKTRKLDEAEKYKNEVVPAARAQAYKMVQDAEAIKAEAIATADGDVAIFNEVYAKYKESPDITRKRLIIETMEKILGSADHKYVVDDNGDGLLKFLPITPVNPVEGGGTNE